MIRVIEWANTVVAVAGLVAFLGVAGYWLLNPTDEPATGSSTGTQSLEDSATRPEAAKKTDTLAPAVESTSARNVENSLNLGRTERRLIQAGLKAAGLAPGPADGVFGAGTRAAIRAWQEGRGEPSTGYLNAVQTRELLVLGRRTGRDGLADRPRRPGVQRRPAAGREVASATRRNVRDVPDGQQGQDTLTGVRGNGKLRGGFGDDILTGTDADDTIHGRHGKDTLTGGGGNDELRGGFGDDTIRGGSGNDTIYAGHGNDFVDAGQGHDVVHGGFGDDTIHGGNGDDTIRAGGGNDTIRGGGGNDVIYGGFGKDVFHFGEAHGSDRILDFKERDDRIDVSRLPVGGFENLSLKRVRRGVQIDLTNVGGGTVLLNRVRIADLNPTHFVF